MVYVLPLISFILLNQNYALADLIANGYEVTVSHTTEGEPAFIAEVRETTKNLRGEESVRTVYGYTRADLTPTPTPTFMFNPNNYKLTKETQ